MDLETLLEICESYSSLGSAVTSQLQDVLDGEDLSEQNPYALDMILELLNEIPEDIEDVEDIKTKIENHLEKIRK